MLYLFWDKVIQPILHTAAVRNVVEIGADTGENTRRLLSYCGSAQGNLTVIDPSPHCPVGNWVLQYPYLTFLPQLSLEALPSLEQYDAILIDGDHNWYTVYHELKNVEKMATQFGKWPLVFLHDTQWPYGRRDLYYLPETIPSEFRHPFQRNGIIQGYPGLHPRGVNGQLCNAVVEGGERNGVLTAVEDFLHETPFSCRFYQLQPYFGLGIILQDNLVLNTEVQQILISSGL